MINRKELITSIFNKKNLVKIIDSFLPVELPAGKEANEISELTGEMLYFEAMELGIDPATIPYDELQKRVNMQIKNTMYEQTPSESGTTKSSNFIIG